MCKTDCDKVAIALKNCNIKSNKMISVIQSSTSKANKTDAKMFLKINCPH